MKSVEPSRLPTRSTLVSMFAAVALAGCGGGSTPAPAPTPAPVTYAVGGTISGLTGSSLVLQDNAGDDLVVATAGSFSFATRLPTGASYQVSVKTQPTLPAQTCAVSQGTGTVSATDVSSIVVTCQPVVADTRPLSLSINPLPHAAMGVVSPYSVKEAQGIVLTSVTWYFDGAPGGHAFSGTPNAIGQVWNTPGSHTIRAVATASNSRTAEATETVVAVGSPLAAGATHTCALTAGGGVQCWGYGGNGNLGNGQSQDQASPVAVSGLANGVLGLAAGDGHSCALKSDGSVVCWGDNTEGQLGNANSYHGSTNTTPVAVDGLGNVVSLAAGRYHTCALTGAGTVACFGQTSEGELGTAASASASVTPTLVAGLANVVAISAGGGYFTCALKADTTVACWGDNESAQLGTGSASPSQTGSPQTVLTTGGAPLSHVLALRSGQAHSCAIVDDGSYSTYCWGWNGNNQVSAGASNVAYAATQVPGLSGTLLLSTTMYSTCSLGLGNSFACWGSNAYGESDGAGTSGANVASPTAVAPLQGASTPEYASGGNEFICVLTASGGASCFGRGSDGELGNGGFNSLPAPQGVTVPGATFWRWEG